MHIFLSHENEVVKSDPNLMMRCPGRVVDILEACGAFDPGSNPGRGAIKFILIAFIRAFKSNNSFLSIRGNFHVRLIFGQVRQYYKKNRK